MSHNTAAVMSTYDTTSYYCHCNDYNVNDGRSSSSVSGNLMAMHHHPSCYYHGNGSHHNPCYPQNGFDTRNNDYGYISASTYLNNNNNNYYDDNHINGGNIATIAGNNKINKVFHNCISYSAAEKKVDYTMAPTTTIETITITRPLKVSLFVIQLFMDILLCTNLYILYVIIRFILSSLIKQFFAE